jgi:hypothetical protein
VQVLDGAQKICLVRRGWEREDLDVIADMEGACVNPKRPAQAASWHVEELTEPRYEVKPILNRPARSIDPETTDWVEQIAAIKDGKRTDSGCGPSARRDRGIRPTLGGSKASGAGGWGQSRRRKLFR